MDGARIAAVGAGLLAADIHLGGAGRCRIGCIERVAAPWRVCSDAFSTCAAGFSSFSQARLQVGAHAFAAALAAEAGFLVAAEADGGVEIVGAVDPDDAGLDLGRDVEREIDVLAPDGRGEAVLGVVGERDRLLGRAEAHGDEHRPEDFLGDQRCWRARRW